MAAERYLVDTNILLRLIVIKDVNSAACQRAIALLKRRDIPLHITLQNASEFWNTCTRPVAANGLGMEPVGTAHALRVLLSQCSILPETPDVFARWLELVTQYAVRGVQAHDARLVATMTAHRIPAILTLNDKHFLRFDVQVRRPEEIVR